VFGATGATGSKVVERALALGHEVVAIVRARAIPPVTGLRVFRAGVLDAASLIGSVEGADAVIRWIGPAKNFSPGTVASQGTSNIVTACQRADVRRFVMQSGITLSQGDELSVANR
jgi:putative NADH-flavin reductase